MTSGERITSRSRWMPQYKNHRGPN